VGGCAGDLGLDTSVDERSYDSIASLVERRAIAKQFAAADSATYGIEEE
jgi:hypothetical protein